MRPLIAPVLAAFTLLATACGISANEPSTTAPSMSSLVAPPVTAIPPAEDVINFARWVGRQP